MASGPLRAPEPAPTPDAYVSVTETPHGPHSMPEDASTTTLVSRDKPFLMDGDMLQVTNLGKKRLEWQWARRRYNIDPGATEFVIFECCVEFLGDPRSVDGQQIRYDLPPGTVLDNRTNNGGRGIILERYSELKRLMARYGVREERMIDFEKINPDTGKLIEVVPGLMSSVPKVHVQTLTGQTVVFPCQEPEMMPFPVANSSARHSGADVSRMIDELAAENQAMREQLAEMQSRMDRQFAPGG